MSAEYVAESLNSYHSGMSLEQAWYCDERVFEIERKRILDNQWYLTGHAAKIPNHGDYFLFKLFGELDFWNGCIQCNPAHGR